jgi:hypothetical protein
VILAPSPCVPFELLRCRPGPVRETSSKRAPALQPAPIRTRDSQEHRLSADPRQRGPSTGKAFPDGAPTRVTDGRNPIRLSLLFGLLGAQAHHSKSRKCSEEMMKLVGSAQAHPPPQPKITPGTRRAEAPRPHHHPVGVQGAGRQHSACLLDHRPELVRYVTKQKRARPLVNNAEPNSTDAQTCDLFLHPCPG